MHIRQMAAEGAGLQCLPALDTLDIPRIPLGGGDMNPSYPPVRLGRRELSPHPNRGADHCLRLGCVHLKPHHPLEEAHQ